MVLKTKHFFEVLTFVGSIINIELLISISNVSTFKFEVQCLILKLKLFIQGFDEHAISKRS